MCAGKVCGLVKDTNAVVRARDSDEMPLIIPS